MSNLILRAIFGSIYVGAIVVALVVDTSRMLYLTLFPFFIFVAIWEYSSIVGCNRLRPLRTILDGAMAVYLFLASHAMLFSSGGSKLLLPYLFYLCYLFVRTLYSDRSTSQTELGRALLGQVYIALPFSLANLSFVGLSAGEGNYLLLLLFLCIWLSDTGAFVVGSSLGKQRLFPSVSPKKSWEGFFGGLVFSAGTAFLLGNRFAPSLGYSDVQWLLLGLMVAVASTWGDLFESLLKRNAGVKDSGHILPGHGGILDRIDSLLFALPFTSFCVLIFNS